jgi:hypothetical protein
MREVKVVNFSYKFFNFKIYFLVGETVTQLETIRPLQYYDRLLQISCS